MRPVRPATWMTSPGERGRGPGWAGLTRGSTTARSGPNRVDTLSRKGPKMPVAGRLAGTGNPSDHGAIGGADAQRVPGRSRLSSSFRAISSGAQWYDQTRRSPVQVKPGGRHNVSTSQGTYWGNQTLCIQPSVVSTER